ncbi:MAG: hypothetical protein IIU59_03505 [Alistipes sp.]|nr:hypothetical protein [Alistipes sp.]
MKRILILLALIVVGVTSAEAQIHIGLNGIELYSDPQDSLTSNKSKTKSNYYPYGSSNTNTKKSKVKYYSTVFSSNLSSIPMLECGWNVLQDVNYAPYAGMEVGEFFDIQNWHSVQLSLNLLHTGIHIPTSKIGFCFGLGVRFNNYRLSPDIMLKQENRLVIPYAIEDAKRSNFCTTSLHMPMELLFGNPNRCSFAVGGYLDLVADSRSVVKYEERKKREHMKNLPTNFIQAGVTARLKFGDFSIFATYQPTQIFKTGCGPNMQSWTIGLGLF